MTGRPLESRPAPLRAREGEERDRRRAGSAVEPVWGPPGV